ncbi:MAG TPA: dihydrodipicolinate synthase family protein [Candidatus Acidoferrales bacterium]|jgi:4-hydroxy-2-oxoglutarate aldolase|nr:dihydrodipicolinate synthase family protein [Candidatus Acidoferrales bacterium]
MPKDLKGIYPAVTTPFAADGSVAISRLRENIARYNKTRVAGYVLNGSTGESVLLRWEEIERVWEAARDSAAPGKILIAGTAAESTAETIEHTNRAAAIGCDVALVRTPHYFKPQMTPAALIEFYLRVADAAKIPVLVYSVPIFTQLKLQADVVGRVAQHPNIIGMKDSSGDAKGVKEILAAVPKSFQMLVGAVSVLHEALQMGAVGAILAVACAFPEMCVEAYEASRLGDAARATATQQKLVSAANLFGPKYGIAGLKYVMDCVGYYGGQPRPPLLPVDEAAKAELDTMLASVVSEAVPGD